MPRGTLLTFKEREKIDVLSAEELTLANIARRLSRTINVVKRYLSNPGEHAKNLFTTGNTKVSKRDLRNILHKASKKVTSASQLRSALNLPISKRHVQQILSARDHLSY